MTKALENLVFALAAIVFVIVGLTKGFKGEYPVACYYLLCAIICKPDTEKN